TPRETRAGGPAFEGQGIKSGRTLRVSYFFKVVVDRELGHTQRPGDPLHDAAHQEDTPYIEGFDHLEALLLRHLFRGDADLGNAAFDQFGDHGFHVHSFLTFRSRLGGSGRGGPGLRRVQVDEAAQEAFHRDGHADVIVDAQGGQRLAGRVAIEYGC